MAQQLLDTLSEQITGCETLAYIDLSTQMVLITNSSTPESQDALNTICREAEALLKNSTTALLGTDERMHVFLRAANEPSDALCCICEKGTNFADLLPAARACLSEISDGGDANG